MSHKRIPQILDAAAELFSRRGIDAAGMNELSEASGLSKAAIYHYFPGKDAIIQGLVKRLFDSDQPYLVALAEARERGALERILDYVDHLGKFLSKTAGLQPVFLECFARASRDATIRKAIAGFFSGYQRLFETILKQGVQSGELAKTTNCKLMGSAVVTQIEGCIVIAHLTGQPVQSLLRRNVGFLLNS